MRHTLIICNNQRLTTQKPSCGASNMGLAAQLEKQLSEQPLAMAIEYRKCLGQCEKGPNIRLAPLGKFFHNIGEDDIQMIIDEIKQFISS